MLSPWKIAPALAAGCTVVHKPAEFSPLSARLLIEIAESAGLPPGVWNLVNGLGEEAGRALTEHPDIRAIGFVGESRTGSMIIRQGADTLKRVHFEPGGKNPVIVFADADLDRAADAAVFMIHSLNGECCTSSSRLLAEAGIQARFTAMVAEKAGRIVVGHPLDPKTVVGPLIHPVHEKKVPDYIAIGLAAGKTAGILTGDVKPAQHYLDLGATFVAAGTDVGLLTQAASRLADQFKGAEEAAAPVLHQSVSPLIRFTGSKEIRNMSNGLPVLYHFQSESD